MQSAEPKSWTDDLPICASTGAGFSVNQIYMENGSIQVGHKFGDRNFYCGDNKDNTYLYAIFSGQNGCKVAEMAMQRIAAEILLGQLKETQNDDDVKNVLRQAFIIVEKNYLDSIDSLLARKTILQCELPENQYHTAPEYQEIIDKLNYINDELSIGTTVVLALIYNSKLYICNVGNCRALLCKSDSNNVLRVVQLSVDHNLYNEDEKLRLRQIGLNESALKEASLNNTRCIGNYMGKSGYKELKYLANATAEPIISKPEIVGAIPIDDSCRFLLLLSCGLCTTLQDIYSVDSNRVNKEIIQMVVENFKNQSTLMDVSQSVVDRIAQLHHDTLMRRNMRQTLDFSIKVRHDITLLVRNFNFPLPNAHQNSNVIQQMSFNPNSQLNTSYFTDSEDNRIMTNNYSEYTNTNSSSSDSNRNTEFIDCNVKIQPYVNFNEYYHNVETAKARGLLPSSIEFE